MLKYIKSNMFPIILEIIFIISCFTVPKEYYIYTNLFFYLILASFFGYKKEFSLNEWLSNLKGGKKFWRQVVLTSIGFVGAFIITMAFESIFPHLNTGMIELKIESWTGLIIFSISTILLPSVVEETFFRKNLISFENKNILIITTIFSMLMYALEHSLAFWGICLTMIWALPLSISYIKTKNIYVPMTAHFICNILGNGINVVFTIIAFSKSI